MEVCIHEVMEEFYRPELGGIIVENIQMDGQLSDSFEEDKLLPDMQLKPCGLSWI